MINYAEKGAGLHRAIAAAGHRLEQRDGIWISSDDVAVQAIIDGYTLAQAKDYKKRAVSAKAREKYDAVTAGVSPAEMAGWPLLLLDAKSYRGGSAAPSVAAEAAARGISTESLVGKVEANAAQFQAARAAIAGTDGKKRDEIDALTTFEAVAAYDVTGGWPL